MPSESRAARRGRSRVVEFVLFDRISRRRDSGPVDRFNHAVSFVVNCEDQAEIDKY